MKTRLGIRVAHFACVALIFVPPFVVFQHQTALSTDSPVSAGEFTLSEPVPYENLTVFLIHGQNRVTPGRLLTLQEALEQNKAVVHETGAVNTLEVENVSSDEDVFIQSGDIVKGGKQDRLITFDLLLPPMSGKVAVAGCCVEHARWQQRGKEAVARFNRSSRQLPSKKLKLYGGNSNGFYSGLQQGGLQQGFQQGLQQGFQQGSFQQGFQQGGFAQGFQQGGYQQGFQQGGFQQGFQQGGFQQGFQQGGFQGGQSAVWSEVGEVQKKLQAKLKDQVTSTESESSLQLTLEHPKVQKAIEKYTRHLSEITAGQKDVIGYAFAINGHVNSVEVYGNAELFGKLWPKLLAANALEAFIEQEEGTSYLAVSADVIEAVVLDAEQAKAVEMDVSERVRMLMRETEKNVLFETRDRQRGTWIHKSYLTK